MTATLLQPLAQVCKDYVLDQKWLIAPNRRIGNQWIDQVNFSGANTVNVHTETVNSVVMRLISAELATRGLQFASGIRSTLVAGKVLGDLLNNEQLSYLHRVESTDTLAQLAAKSMADYRLADLDPDDLDRGELEDPDKANDLQALLSLYQEELTQQNLIDYSACLKLAIEMLDSGSANLPSPLILVIPMEVVDSKLEAEFLQRLIQRCDFTAHPTEPDEEFHQQFAPSFRRAIGEVNEIQSVLQDVFQTKPNIVLDQVEILHTDYPKYVPLIHETLASILAESNSSIDELPVTFGEGIACIYSRPGRALRSWLRWIRFDFPQTLLCQLIREGLLRFDDDAVGIGYAQLAHRLRKLPIGFDRTRYEVRLEESIREARVAIELAAESREDSDGEHTRPDYDYGLAAFERLKVMIVPLIETSPSPDSTSQDVLAAARRFLVTFARCTNKVDQYARDKMLDDILAMEQAISVTPEIEFKVWDWLENLPVESRILASAPRSGCIHVDHIAKGGHSGRANTYIVGLDDSRFPFRGGQDPLLLDFERKKLSGDLPTSGDISVRSAHEFSRLLDRLTGRVSFSYAAYSLVDDRELFPSSALLDTFRDVTNQPTASLDDFQTYVGSPDSFCSRDSTCFVRSDHWWYLAMATRQEPAARVKLLESRFSHFAQARLADEQRAANTFTQYDGFVPAAGKDLDPTKEDSYRVSPSRLETLGKCPRKFFFRYGLGVSPPDEHVVDPQQWLDPLALGSLIHGLFEDFLRELTLQNRVPKLSKDVAELHQQLHRKIDLLKETIPVPNEDAYQRQLQRLEKTCEIFLRHEEEYCKTTDAVPWVFEASIGLQDPPESEVDSTEPVPLHLSDGRVIQVGGRIDRIDRIGGSDSLNFAIWDYKSGSSWGFDKSDPLRQGRKLQPFLYVGMLKHRLQSTVGADADVNYFGYFFPSPRTEGLRLQWTQAQLASGDEVLRHICDLISSGSFIATNDKSDCGFCDYLPICGTPYETAAASLSRLESCPDEALDPMRKLRGISLVAQEEPR